MNGSDLHRAMQLVLAAGALDREIHAFRVEGEPIAKARARRGRRGFYTPAGTSDAEDVIAYAVREHAERIEGNVALAAVFYRSNRHRVDVDNLLKTVLDGITRSGAIWEDDSHVTAVAGVVEFDAACPRTTIAIGRHLSTLKRGIDSLTHTCVTCGKKYHPHGGRLDSKYCSRACRPRRVQVCADCGGPTSAPRAKRCQPCHLAWRSAA